MSAQQRLPVLVVGGGPVGLTVANLLAARGIPLVLVERNASTSDEAKAISLDDESLRTLETAGLADKVLEVVVPGTGTRYYDRKGRPLFHARGPQPYRLGFPFKNQFAQPELEKLLLDELKSRPGADIRFATELVTVTDDPDGTGATAAIRAPGGTATEDLRVSWVLACDGGRSTVRELRGIGMTGTSHQEVWLVADTTGDHHDERYGMHHGTPDRPTVVVPGRGGRCRYEFLLYPGEGEKGVRPDFETLRRLVAPYRPLTEDQVERCTTYTFNAVVADKWRDGRVLLLGDAAHMMPPFAGQGLNSGVRDAANVAWKIDDVWHGRAGESLLDTYEAERRPHATAMVRYSKRLGDVVMTTDRHRALVRDVAARALLRVPPGRRYLTEMRFRPHARHEAGLVVGDHALTGTQLPQPRVLVPPSLRPQWFDQVLGGSFALLGVDVPEAAWQRFDGAQWPDDKLDIKRIDVVLGDRLPPAAGPREAVADADGRLEEALATARNRFVLVKPDHYIAAVMGPDDLPTVAAVLRRETA
ncbi:bifunctional 3-(3-hydroxy-phenyl)propionate/3-hydroxycinnamic acid hydroxylase [Streptomyces sp. WAC05458]|uniref:Bifunctional 3-(3-hydroxy-phenyl)propionate/3-hydroxycinnamic acid hydroxylase n=1 Tax=Streptomyces rochei TaxID=1928 RepID=A0ABW7E973_STRRO|nr:bifunctional 3-(3-hydroxy-phenyl)propionate/3-hydroxycinnamic acid hydroxylase [Streptomyces sp. WAC05458]RSS17521.1 bifunctional 3-(3-hydroxy-phenyl)propionate/3-hydroxycinnamic acid hydroxylase [Streptomyces sp. WAC05458]